jgi:hypothetical protein
VIRPPSSYKNYDAFWSQDPAIVQLPDGATKEQRDAHEKRLEVAHETGLWTEVTCPGQQPTVFTMRQLPCEAFLLLQQMAALREPNGTIYSIAFRLSVVGVKNLASPDPTISYATDVRYPQFGKMASTSFLDEAECGGQLGAAVIFELGQLAYERAGAFFPKS